MKKFFQVLGIAVFVIFILLTLAVLGGIIFLKSFDIKKYKPQIIAAASNALGRAVDFKDIDLAVSMDKGIRLHLTDFSVAENPDFGTESFAVIKEIDAGVDIAAYLASRQILVPGVMVRSPQVTVIRNSAGVLNIQTIGPKAVNSASSSGVSPALTIPAILINSFKIEDAQVTFVDRTMTTPLQLVVSQLTLDVERFSLTNPFAVSLEAAVLSSEKNFSLNGQVQLSLAKPEVVLSSMEAALNLNQLPLEKLKAFPQLAAVSLPRLLEGQLKIKVRDVQISDKGLGRFSGDVFFNNGRIMAQDIAPGVSLEARKLDIGVENFSLDSLAPARVNVKAALYQDETNIDFSGKVSVDLKKMEVRLTDGEFATELAYWPVKKLKTQIFALKDVPLPENLSGKLQAMIKDALVSSAGLQTVLLDAKWQGGLVSLNDVIPGVALTFDKTDIAIGNFSFGKQFTVAVKTAYLSETPNISFDGAVSFDLPTEAVTVKNGIAQINFNGFALDRFKASGLVPQGVPFPQAIDGVFQIQIKDLAASSKGLGDMNLGLKWQNGKIVLNNIVEGTSVAADHITAEIKDFTLGSPFDFDVKFAYLGNETNIQMQGVAAFSSAEQTISLKDAKVHADLAKISLPQLKASIAALKDVSLPQQLRGNLDVAIANVVVGPAGLTALDSNIKLGEGEVKLKELAVPISGLTADFKVSESQLISQDFVAHLGKGQMTLKVDVTDYLKKQDFNLSAQIQDLDLAEILDQSQSAVKVAGSLFGVFNVKGQGADLNALAGDGSFEVKEAKLKDLNIFKTVLDKIVFIPNLRQRIEVKLPENYKAKLDSQDTAINKVAGTFVLNSGIMVLDPFAVEADEFVLSGKAQAKLDQTYNFDGTFKITKELSAIMGQSTQELQYLYDSDNNISLPVHISGQGNQSMDIAVTQSALDISKNAARNQGKKELGRILDKALGIPQDAQSQQQDQDAPAQEQESPGTKIIGGILDKVFK